MKLRDLNHTAIFCITVGTLVFHVFTTWWMAPSGYTAVSRLDTIPLFISFWAEAYFLAWLMASLRINFVGNCLVFSMFAWVCFVLLPSTSGALAGKNMAGQAGFMSSLLHFACMGVVLPLWKTRIKKNIKWAW